MFHGDRVSVWDGDRDPETDTDGMLVSCNGTSSPTRNRTWRSYSPSAGVRTAHQQRAGPRNKAEWTEADPAAVRIKVAFPSTGEETHTVLQTTWDIPVVAGKARL